MYRDLTLEEVLDHMKAAMGLAEHKREELDSPKYSEQYRQKQLALIDQELTNELDGLREQAATLIAEARDAAELELAKARRANAPQTAEEWQIAAAQLPFVRLELDRAGAEAVPEMYDLALAVGDRVRAYVLGQQAIAQFEARIDEIEGASDAQHLMSNREFRAANAALRELQTRVAGDAGQRYDEERTRLNGIEREIRDIRTADELDEYEGELRERFRFGNGPTGALSGRTPDEVASAARRRKQEPEPDQAPRSMLSPAYQRRRLRERAQAALQARGERVTAGDIKAGD